MNIETRSYEILLDSSILVFCDDLDISSDDIVYFVDASKTIRVPEPSQVLRASFHAVAAGHSDGRLLKYTPLTGSLETLINDLSFANGVTLSHDERSLLVSDGSPLFKIRRYWLEGPKKGSQELFMDKLPGYGDGISRASNGTFWVAVFARVDTPQYILFRFRLTRWLGLALPEKIAEAIITQHGIILQVIHV